MHKQIKPSTQKIKFIPSDIKTQYYINTDFLLNLGFEKNEALSSEAEWIYRYYSPAKACYGIELVFIKEFSILSVEEFWLDNSDDFTYVSNSIVGKFKICSDEDLGFIFSRNIKLNHIFNVEGKRA